MDRDQGTATTANTLETLRHGWGEAYEFESDGDLWRARRRDGRGGWLDAVTPEALRNEVAADYMTSPVRITGQATQ